MFHIKDRDNGRIEAGGRAHGNEGKVVEMRAVGTLGTVVVTRLGRDQRVWCSPRTAAWLRGQDGN